MPWHFLDRFIHPSFQKRLDDFYKARLLVGILLSVAISVVSFWPMFFLIDGLPTSAHIGYIAIGGSALVLWSLLLIALKRSDQHFQIIAQLALFSMLIVLFAGISITGGTLQTEIHPLLSVPSVIAFLLLGHKKGIYWSAAILLCFILFSVIAIRGTEFYNLPPEILRPALRVFNWSYAFIIIASLTYLYELISSSNLKESDLQQQHYKRISDVAMNSEIIHDTANQLSHTGEELLNSTIHQKAAIESLATTTEELLATSEDNLKNASTSLQKAAEIKKLLEQCHDNSQRLNEAMSAIKSSNQEIQMINNLINDIAQQTNLLSLNAMIEASRFEGENGGFQVVALEVKKLAELSVEAVGNINKVLAENTNAVEQGFNFTQTLSEQVIHIQTEVDPVTFTNQQVVDGCNEQTLAISQLNHSVQQIDEAISNNRKLAMNATLLADDMQDEASKLKQLAKDAEQSS